MVLVGAASIMALDGLVPWFFAGYFHGASLIFMMLYLWSKQTPDANVGFFGVIQFKSVYLPFALLALDVIQGASPTPGVHGILAGHVYYFLTEVYPQASGRRLISTPTWL
jgi:Derlin-2/3